jgi:hypothetical protein
MNRAERLALKEYSSLWEATVQDQGDRYVSPQVAREGLRYHLKENPELMLNEAKIFVDYRAHIIRGFDNPEIGREIFDNAVRTMPNFVWDRSTDWADIKGELQIAKAVNEIFDIAGVNQPEYGD